MKKKIIINEHNKKVEREVNYIPFRYIVAIFLVVLETKENLWQRFIRAMVKVFSPLF